MGYYYETEATGVPEVDAIGQAIDAAGNAYHHTSDWYEQDGNGRCVLDDINDALKACAAEITRLRTPAPVAPEAEDDIAMTDKECAELRAKIIELFDDMDRGRIRVAAYHQECNDAIRAAFAAALRRSVPSE